MALSTSSASNPGESLKIINLFVLFNYKHIGKSWDKFLGIIKRPEETVKGDRT